MTNYRRTFAPGATYFFAVNLADRRRTLLVDHIDLLREASRYTRQRHSFIIDAMVVLPNHLHAIWTLPPGDADSPLHWRLIKTWFSRYLVRGEHRRASRIDKGERSIWQRRYWEHLISDEADFARHVDYIPLISHLVVGIPNLRSDIPVTNAIDGEHVVSDVELPVTDPSAQRLAIRHSGHLSAAANGHADAGAIRRVVTNKRAFHPIRHIG